MTPISYCHVVPAVGFHHVARGVRVGGEVGVAEDRWVRPAARRMDVVKCILIN